MIKRRDFLAGGVAAAFAGSHSVVAQEYPSKPVKILVSTAAGGWRIRSGA